MVISRLCRHLFVPRWVALRVFPPATLAAVERAIVAAESRHDGQIRFVIEVGLDFGQLLRGVTARARALEAFSMLRVWDTERNNGVLVYVLLADRDVEIIADRGIHRVTGTPEWQRICRLMRDAYAVGDYRTGSVDGIRAIADVLARVHPRVGDSANELPDAPVVL